MTFVTRLKRSLVGDESARFVYLGNFEVERSWAAGEPKLPGAGIAFANSTVNRMEELGVLLADPGDVVVLKAAPSERFLDHLRGLGLAAGTVLVADVNEPARSVTDDALASPRLLDALRALADGRTFLMPLGISPAEEELAKETGLPLAGPSAATCKAVNGKVFSRRLADRAGLTQVPGTVVETAGELAAAVDAHFAATGRVVVKESLGVSGRGMVVLEDRKRADRLVRMVARRGADARVDLVVEEWIDKVTDLNYQFVVSRRGEVRFETVKAAVVRDGVHSGHRFPVELPPGADEELRHATRVIGEALHAEGHYGMVGVDAMLGRDGTLYPCLEINARFNMSTYQSRIAELHVPPGAHAVAATITLTVTGEPTFDDVATALGDLLLDGSGRPGVLISNFATLNAGATPDEPDRARHGRLYAVCVAGDDESALSLRAAAEQALQKLVDPR